MTATVTKGRGEAVSTAEVRSRLGEQGLAIVDVRPLPRSTAGVSRATSAAATSRARWRSRPAGSAARRRRAEARCSRQGHRREQRGRRLRGRARPSRSSTAASPSTCGAACGPRRRLHRVGRGPRRSPSSASRATSELVHPDVARGAARRRHARGRARRTRSCSSTSTSACPRSTPTAICPGALYLDTNLLESPRDWNRRSPEELDAALRRLGITADTTVILYGRDTEGGANEKWPGRRAGQIAATRAALILSYSGVEDVRAARRRLRRVGAGGRARRDGAARSRPRSPPSARRCPSAPRADRRHRGREADPRRSRRRRPRQRPHLARARRRGQRLQLHRAGRPDRGRRVGQLRHRRLPHAALPQPRQHDAAVPRDRRQLGRGRDHARQVGRVLLRHRLARERDLVLRVPDGLAADRRLRRRLVGVEREPGREPDRGRGARRPEQLPRR